MKNQSKIIFFILFTGLSILFYSCISNVEEQLEEPNVITEVSFKNAVKPIIDARCTTCHSPAGGRFPDLTTFEGVKASSERVMIRVANGTMPQDGALPDAQIKIIVDWVNQGALDN